MSESWKQTIATIAATAAFLLLGWIAHGMQELRNDVESLRENMNVRLERIDERLDDLEQNQAVLLEPHRTASAGFQETKLTFMDSHRHREKR